MLIVKPHLLGARRALDDVVFFIFRKFYMTNKHSPGPWVISKEKKFNSGYSCKSFAITDANGHIVLLFDPSDGEYSEALDIASPNAKLIAAAPEMFEALMLCRSHMHEHASNTPDNAFHKLCAAIDKAILTYI